MKKQPPFFSKNKFVLIAPLVATMACVLVGCAPDPTPRQYTQPKVDFGPRSGDPDLGLGASQQSQAADLSKLEISGDIDSASLMRTSENLLILSKATGRTNLQTFAQKLTDAFYHAPGTSASLSFDKTPYIDAATGETKASSLAIVVQNEKRLDVQSRLVVSLVKGSGQSFPWPNPNKMDSIGDANRTIAQLFTPVHSYVSQLLRLLQTNPKIDEQIRGPVVEGIDTQAGSMIAEIEAEIYAVFNEPRLSGMIQRLITMLNHHEFEVDTASRDLLTRASAVGDKIEVISDAQDVLAVIVDLWRMIPPETRQSSFKAVSPELYDFLSGRSESDLNCLRAFPCINPIIASIKQLKILPEIRSRGIAQLQMQLRDSTRQGVIAEVQVRAARMLPTLPDLVATRIGDEFGKIRGILAAVKSDYPGFVRGIGRRFADKNLGNNKGGLIFGAEAARANVSWSKGAIDIRALGSAGKIETSAAVIGTSLSLAAARWTQTPMNGAKAAGDMISQINKLLAVGGYTTGSGKLFNSLSLATNPDENGKHLNLRTFLSEPTGFAMPDSLLVTPDFDLLQNPEMKVNARAQADLLRGFSTMTAYFRDWQTNAFDSSLGKATVGQYVGDLPAASIKEKLFPKDMMFSVSIGNASVLLQNIRKKLTPIFMIDTDSKLSWADDTRADGASPLTMAGVVDLVNGKRDVSANSLDVSSYILALIEFVEATEGVENTKASVLLEKGKDGTTALQTLVKARADLRLAIVALSNFLSHQMQDKDGGIRQSFSLDKVKTEDSEPRTLLDQAMAIRALVRASAFLKTDIYRWAALDVLAFMNRSLFDRSLGFYRSYEMLGEMLGEIPGVTGAAPNTPGIQQTGAKTAKPKPTTVVILKKQNTWVLEEVTATLLAGEQLKAYMPDQSRKQWDHISAPWLAAFENPTF
jgi:hypothetical protein